MPFEITFASEQDPWRAEPKTRAVPPADRSHGSPRLDGLGLAAGDDAVRELKDGWFNAAYRAFAALPKADGREVILKIAPPQGAEVMQYEQNIMAIEVAAMRLVQRNPAIPVPAIYSFDDACDLCDSAYFFMQKVNSGTTWST